MPMPRFKLERHKAFLRFQTFALTKNLSSSLLAELCGATRSCQKYLPSSSSKVKRRASERPSSSGNIRSPSRASSPKSRRRRPCRGPARPGMTIMAMSPTIVQAVLILPHQPAAITRAVAPATIERRPHDGKLARDDDEGDPAMTASGPSPTKTIRHAVTSSLSASVSKNLPKSADLIVVPRNVAVQKVSSDSPRQKCRCATQR